MKRITLLMLAMLIAGSTWWMVLTPTSLYGPGVHQLPTTKQTGCMGFGLEGVMLHGSLDYPRLAWIDSGTGNRTDVVWPSGFSASFAPDLEVLDATGHVVAVEGSLLTGACVTDDPRVLFLDDSSFTPDSTT